jgi:predicted Fe-Mo cluster-binding NifX family protein
VDVIPNRVADEWSGVGTKAAESAVNKGADAVITGRLVPMAVQVLNAAGIPICVRAFGKAREALAAFKDEGLEEFMAGGRP